ncbi:hypothetical protein B6D60_03485 [candidate division KSB1 bacterium 4484_87]|nr:MAG: hypothetical protein B6D60_03485 [candidate division KSB1 bacterium 4484_87]
MKWIDNLSLRARLSLLYVTLLIFSVSVLGIYSYWNVWQLLVQNKSDHLRARAKPIIEHWLTNSLSDTVADALSPATAAILARDLTSRNTAALILNNEGKILANGKRLPEEPDAPSPDSANVRLALAGENEIRYRTEENGPATLVLLIPIRPQPGSPHVLGVVQLSTSLSDIDQMLFHHGLMLIAVVGVILILGSGLGFWLTGSSLTDLRKLAVSCRQIAKGDFSKRASAKNQRDEIGQLAKSFNQMIDRLEATFAAQQRFVANAAHELLTPLTGLQGSLEVLLRGAQDDPAAVARLSKGMYQEVTRLIRLCDQLLGLSRLEGSIHLRKTRIALPDFFADFVQQAKLLSEGRQIKLSQGPFITVVADEDMLKQILLNLFTNAVRHSPAGSTITLIWKLLPQAVEVRIADQGEGMDEKTLQHIFEPFFQGKASVSKREKGAGLGLTLAKSMIEAHDGSISVQSEPGKGTTVIFTLPLE